MPVIDSTSRFVPTLKAARIAQLPLPDGEPFEQEKWSALFVLAAVMRRRTWREQMITHPKNLGPIGSTPPPPEGFTQTTQAVIESMGERGICLACTMSPGLRRCRVCMGRGSYELYGQGTTMQCSCGSGFVPCPSCLGEKVTHRMLVRFYEDTPASMREFLIPSHLPCYPGLFRLESAMEAVVGMEVPPPEELRCHDLSGQVGGSAYRGGSRVQRPTFEGHDFGDTIDRALEQVRALQGGFQITKYEIRANAWPILRLRYQNPADPAKPIETALFYSRSGELQLHRDS